MANRTYCPSCGHRVDEAKLDLTADKPGSVLPILSPCGHHASPVKVGPPTVADEHVLRTALDNLRRVLVVHPPQEGKGSIVPGVDLEIVVDAMEARLGHVENEMRAAARGPVE